LASAELFDPATGTFTLTGSLNVGRDYQTATLLSSGKVLITGGMDMWGNVLNSAELYDPSTGAFTLISAAMNSPRKLHTATLLGDGTVLLAGGTSGFGTDSSLALAEIYDPSAATFTAVGSLGAARSEHSAALLANGKVLIAGGWAPDFTAVGVSELYDPSSGAFTGTGSLGAARGDAIAVTLQDGTVLIGGGWDTNFNTLTSLELYDPAAGTFAATASLHTERGLADASLLGSGSVLITGGLDNNSSALASAEIYQPAQSGPPLPNIASLSSASGPVGTSVTITGTNFGAAQQNSTVLFGGVTSQITSWSDTSIVSSVPLGVSIGQTAQVVVTTANGSSNPSNFAVTACNVAPRAIGLVSGQSRMLSVTDGTGNQVTGITWSTSDPIIASLSTDDPPEINAVAPGTATIYVCGLSVNVTVYSGPSLPAGAPIWSVPVGNGSGNISVVPAVPSDSGADVFALDNSGTLTAFSSDGTPVWKTSGIPGGSSSKVIPDFSGNAVLKVPYSFTDSQGNAHITHAIKGIDPSTRQLVHLYTFSDHPANVSGFIDDGNAQAIIPHPAGPLFVQDVAAVHVLDRVAGAPIADIQLENSSWNTGNSQGTQAPVTRDMIVAGDGNAYLPYIYYTENTTTTAGNPYSYVNDHTVTRLMLLRVSPDGTYAKTELRNWSGDHTQDPSGAISCSGAAPQSPFRVLKPITNADQGVAVFASAIFIRPLITSGGGCRTTWSRPHLSPMTQ
jgi:IPT/TIG domain/Kelch motif